jgi:hypothetical protein
MPSLKVNNQTTAANCLQGLKFVKLSRRALVSLYISGVSSDDKINFSFTDREVLVGANPNIEIAPDVIDTSRDGVLFGEPGMPGDELFMPVTATTAVNFLIVIDEV